MLDDPPMKPDNLYVSDDHPFNEDYFLKTAPGLRARTYKTTV